MVFYFPKLEAHMTGTQSANYIRIRCHFLADMHIPRYVGETKNEKHILWNI